MSNVTFNGRVLSEAERLRLAADDETGQEARFDAACELADLLREYRRERALRDQLRRQLLEIETTMAGRELRVRELQRMLGLPVEGAEHAT